MDVGINPSQGLGVANTDGDTSAHKSGRTGRLGNMKYQQADGKGATRASERSKSPWNRLTTNVTSFSRALSFFTGGAERAQSAKSDGDVNMNQWAKQQPLRPAMLPPRRDTSSDSIQESGAPDHLAKSVGDVKMDQVAPAKPLRSALKQESQPAALPARVVTFADPPSPSGSESSVASTATLSSSEDLSASDTSSSPVSLRSQQSDRSPAPRPAKMVLAGPQSAPTDESPARVDSRPSSAHTGSSSSDEESSPTDVKLRTQTSSRQAGVEWVVNSDLDRRHTTLDGRVPGKAADQSDTKELRAKNTVLEAQNDLLKTQQNTLINFLRRAEARIDALQAQITAAPAPSTPSAPESVKAPPPAPPAPPPPAPPPPPLGLYDKGPPKDQLAAARKPKQQAPKSDLEQALQKDLFKAIAGGTKALKTVADKRKSMLPEGAQQQANAASTPKLSSE